MGRIFNNPVDVVFFGAILAGVALFVILFVISKVVQKQKDKKYEAEFEAKKKNQETQVEELQKKTTKLEENTVVEEVPTEDDVEEQKKTLIDGTVEENDAVLDKNIDDANENEEETHELEPIKEESVLEETSETEEESIIEEIKEEKPNPKKSNPAKGRTYNGKYEVYPNGDGYQYRLKASNGEVLIVSETYASRDGVIKAIDAVKRNVETGEIRIIEDKHGKFKFKLTSKNYRVVALGANYSTEKSAVRASESFKKFALKADIVDIIIDDDLSMAATVVDVKDRTDKFGGKFIIDKYNGEYSWDLKATNGQILCQAEGYMSKVGVLNSIESFKRNVEVGSFKVIKDKNGHYHYNLYTPTGRVAAIGETYTSKQQAESAVYSVVSFYKNAEVVEKNNIQVS